MIAANGEFYFPGGRDGVLLIHGLTGTPSEMRFVGRRLHDAGYSVLGVRLAGHCGSEDDLIASTRHHWWDSVLDAHRRLSGVCDRVFAGGLSMGALLALKLAIERPDDIAGLALYGSTLRYDGWTIPFWARLSFLLPYVLKLGWGRKRRFMEQHPYGIKDQRVRDRIVGCMLNGDSAAAGLAGNPWPSLAEFSALSREVRRRLPQVRTPTLLIHAADDDVASISNSFEIARRIHGPIELMVLYDSHHMITVDGERRQVSAKTAEFFARIPRGATVDVTDAEDFRVSSTGALG